MLIRHGETEWSAAGRHTSSTDVDLTPRGAEQATALGSRLAGQRFGTVLCSPRRRARRTAELAGLTAGVDADLAEWAYGSYEGLTTAQILRVRPDWSLWRDGAPGGESPDQVGERADRLLARVRARLDAGESVALVAHGHILRVVGARWIGQPPYAAGSLALDTAATCVLGFEHDRPVIMRWNLPG